MNETHVVVVQPAGISFVARPGESVMAAAERAGFQWPTVCHGSAICTRCWIRVSPDQQRHLSPMCDREEKALMLVRWRPDPRPDERLACQAQPVANVTVYKEGVRARSA